MDFLHEEGFVSNFIQPAKKQRLLGFLKNPKNRWKALLDFEHFTEKVFDLKFGRKFKGNVLLLTKFLEESGASGDCYLISNSTDIDGKKMPLKNALKMVIGSGLGTIISCIPGKLAFFEDEMGEQYIFHNTQSKSQ